MAPSQLRSDIDGWRDHFDRLPEDNRLMLYGNGHLPSPEAAPMRNP